MEVWPRERSVNSTVNPFAPPKAHVADIETANSDAERTRQEHIKRETSIRSVGLLYYIGGFFMLVAGVGLSVVAFTPGAIESPEAKLLFILGPVYLGLGGLSVAVARGLRKLQPWARLVCIVLSAIGLLGFPLGTLINGYILYLVLSAQGKRVFEDDYPAIVAATPHIKYRTSVVTWVVLALLILAFVAVGFFLAIQR
jgi:hypothetical protein